MESNEDSLAANSANPPALAASPRKHWLDFLAFVTASSALFVSAYSAYQTRLHNRLSVVPHLAITAYGPFRSFTADSDPKLELWLVNNGAGVAVIESISVTTDMTTATDLREVYRVMGLSKSKYFQWWNYSTPYYVRAGDRLDLFSVDQAKLALLSPEARAAELQDLAERTKRLKIVLKYKSIYDEPATATWPEPGRNVVRDSP